MTNWQYNSEEKSGTLSFDSDMTIAHVAEIKKRLVEALNDAEQVVVDVSAATAIDVAGIQLLCACHRYSCQNGKQMCVELGDNEMFASFLDEVGFSRSFVCTHGSDDNCLLSVSH